VRIIAKSRLRQFWAKYPNAESPLNTWHKVVEHAHWSKPGDIRDTYRTADTIGDEFAVFDVCHNEYRLVVRVDYQRSIVYIYEVCTHAEYDRLDLKSIDEQIRREKQQGKT
jgi:mRNA interferase HigB